MGSGPTTTSAPQLPPLAQQLNRQSLQTALNLSPAAWDAIGAQFAPQPEGVAPITQPAMYNIGQLENVATYGSPQEAAAQTALNEGQGFLGGGAGFLTSTGQNIGTAENLLGEMTSGPIGSSPATQAGMNAWSQLVEPTIASSLAASSGGRGGALPAAISQGETAAAVPLIQQEIANREAGIGQASNLVGLQGSLSGAAGNLAGVAAGLGGAESALSTQRTGDVQNAINATTPIQTNEQAALDSQFNAQQQVNSFLDQIGLGPYTQLTPLAVGQQSITSPGKF